MNRIRKINNNLYQVLVPLKNSVSAPNAAYMYGNWLNTSYYYNNPIINDLSYNNQQIITTETMNEAMAISYEYWDIDWNKLVSMHKDSFLLLKNIIYTALKNINYNVSFISTLLSPVQTKNLFFDKVANYGNHFDLFYNFNDIISFDIITPYLTYNEYIKNLLINNSQLNIQKVIYTKSHISLIGITSIQTTYEIRIWTSLYYTFIKWIYDNNLNINNYINQFNEISTKQKILDSGFRNYSIVINNN